MSRSRPDRVAAWAFVLGIFLILLAATTSRGDTGGALVPPPPGATGPVAGAPAAAELGERVLQRGQHRPRCPHFAGNSPSPRLWRR